VPAPRLAFDVLPVEPSFVQFRPPRRDDAPFVIVFIRVNHGDFQAVHQADRINSSFTVVKSVINLLNRRPVEYPRRILEGNAMPNDIAEVLLSVPTIAHRMYLHNVNMK
jgi:hypothetical protein